MAYLLVSLLGPLSWMLVVEICRRGNKAEAGPRSTPGSNSAARLALPIAKLRKPAAATWETASGPKAE